MISSLTFHITLENLTFFSLWWTSLFLRPQGRTNFIINDIEKAVVQVSHRRLAIKISWTTPVYENKPPVHNKRPYRYIGLLLVLRPANNRRRYKAMPSLTGWAHT